jgi:hypothetical protein
MISISESGIADHEFFKIRQRTEPFEYLVPFHKRELTLYIVPFLSQS